MENIENKVFEIKTEKSFGCLVIFLISCCFLPVIAGVFMILKDLNNPLISVSLLLLSVIILVVLVIFCIH
ncbi:MAG: hypothetical protein J6S61_02080, partial [Elusimicrobiaceae bacterium]|nr:hypothetical protein [Elusimicrobiaceae bacterium]